jgi:protein SCO1
MSNLRYHVVALLCVVSLLTGCGLRHEYAGTLLEPPKPLTNVTLPDQHGQPFQLSGQRDTLTLLYFGFTNCPDFCPSTMGEWKQIKQLLGADAEKLRFVLISVDPERDTEQALKEYLDHFDPTFVGLRPTPEQVEQLSREYGVGVDSHSQHVHTPDPTKHGSYTYLIDQSGQLRMLFSFDIQPQQIADDIRALLRSS